MQASGIDLKQLLSFTIPGLGIELDWITVLFLILVFVLGLAIGALVWGGIFTYLNRLPVINRRVDIFPSFQDVLGADCLSSQITISDGSQEYQYSDLHIVEIKLANQSQEDFADFEFGITLPAGNSAIYIEALAPDRHHHVKQLTTVNFSQPQSAIDFVLHPFDRTNSYSLRLLVLVSADEQALENIQFSSPQAIRFIDLPTVVEKVEAAARSTSIALGPFEVSLDE